MAQDITGKELAVGQSVAYCMAGQSQSMRVAKIVNILPKTVELDVRHDWVRDGKGIRRNHTAVAIVSV